MFNFEDALKLICHQTVLRVGDVMLDDFVYGEVARISPKAPAPVLAVTKSELMIGGADNVARDITGLGARWRNCAAKSARQLSAVPLSPCRCL
jgi:D-beta-D-heptose 7-phosphate kinase/D-beta-D-heptose 1-phosphate adenosyltransferase